MSGEDLFFGVVLSDSSVSSTDKQNKQNIYNHEL